MLYNEYPTIYAVALLKFNFEPDCRVSNSMFLTFEHIIDLKVVICRTSRR